MRRATFAAMLLAGVLAAPAPAHGQATPTAGQVNFDNSLIGAEACTSTVTSTRTVHAAWLDQLETGQASTVSGVFRVFATNVAPTANGNGAKYCAITDNPNNQGGPVFAGQVGSDIPNAGGQLSGVADLNTAQIAQRAGVTSCTTNGLAVYVCVHFHPYQPGTNNTPQANPTAWAVGTMTLSFSKPSTPGIDSVLPGNQALNVDWHDGGAPAAAKYKVRAVSLANPGTLPPASAFDPNGGFAGYDPRDTHFHESGFITGTGPYRLSGLVNDVPYAVAVVGFSEAESAGDPSDAVTSVPQHVNDFWGTYQAAGGRETGGCASGVAGPLGLLVLAGTLALVRRRK